jgi:aminoacrylate hydrolase
MTALHSKNILHYRVEGAGPPVVLIAGLGGLGEFWQPVSEQLARSNMVISFDHPGVGNSPMRGSHTIASIANEVRALLDHLGIDNAHIVGHSTGGLVAQALALDSPALVGRVVISGSWARADRRFRDLFELRRTVLERLGLEAYKALGNLIAYPADWYEANLARDERLDFDKAADANANTATIAARIDMLLTYDRARELANITAPVLVIGAPDDQVVPFYHSQELARLIPHARLVEIAGGHFFPRLQPNLYVSSIRNHLEPA